MTRALIAGLLIAQAAILPKGVRAQTPTLPSDFAVRFGFGLCTTDVLDTFKNVFVRDMGSRDPAVAVSVVLQTDWLKAIYGAIVEARFFEYPSEFRISGNIGFAPADHYRLEVRSGGVFHAVSWHDAIGPSRAQADRLRALFTRIRQLVTDLPEVKRLPTPRIGCG